MKSKFSIKKAAACMSVFALAAALGANMAGCSANSAQASSEQSNSTVIVVQNTGCAPHYNGSFAQEAAKNALENRGYLDIVIADGDPKTTIGAGTVVGSTSDSPDKRNRENEASLYNIMAAIDASTASADEVDMLAAFEYAARSLASAPEGKGNVAVAATGFSRGVLDFSVEGMLQADPDEVATYLKEKGLLPDLGAISVLTWYGFGDVEAPQEEPSQAVKTNMQGIYEAVLKAAGVREVVFSAIHASAGNAQPGALPTVTPIAVPAVESLRLQAEAEQSAATGEPVRLDGTVLLFEPDSAVLVDPTAASAALAPFVGIMANDSAVTATLSGSCASYPWDAGYAQNLSERRAEAVKALMVSMGVDAAKVTTIGLGDGAPDHVADIDEATGLQIPGQAALNRYVEIELLR